MKYYQKQTGFTILAVIILSASLFLGAKQHPDKQKRSGSAIQTQSVVSPMTGTIASINHNGKAIRKFRPIATKSTPQVASSGNQIPVIPFHKGKLTAYLAAQAKGVIGLFDGNRTDNPADNIFSVTLDCQPTASDKVWLTYQLTGVIDHSGVACSVNDRPAFGGYLVKKDTATTRQRIALNALWLQKGTNRIQFGLQDNADYGYRVSDLALEIEQGAEDRPLVVEAAHHLYNGKAYVHGFVQGQGSTAHVSIDGREAAVHDGEFEAIVTPDGQDVEVKATVADRVLTRSLHFDTTINADKEYALTPTQTPAIRLFEKGKPNELKTADVMLKTDDKALISNKLITLTSLRQVDMPALDLGMTNVTADNKGFRFLPHGEHFTQAGATVALKYDRTKIPDGYTENDIKTFYFDNTTNHWVALARDTVDRALCMVVSKTTHFTDMINGVIKTPESPQTEGFAPTMMNDIKAADPTSKIELIAPPTANNSGSANLSYSLEMPPARNGMSPQLAISYNSDGGSGWLGEGWDLNIPSITVDTRWGVPRYDGTKETETYSMAGTMLVTTDANGNSSVAHRGEKIVRVADRQFYPRIEGSYSKIIRKGNSPSNYYWEVTDKNGTTYTYGGYDASLKGTITTITGQTKEIIAEWKLKRVEEIHGDYIEYEYNTDDELVRAGLYAKAIYLVRIKAGNKGSDPHTMVTFQCDSVNLKAKQQNNGRFGFLVSNNKLLKKVSVAFEGKPLRSYSFDYTLGAFGNNLLSVVNQMDNEGSTLATHTFDYNHYQNEDDGDYVSNGWGGYKNVRYTETWNLHEDGLATPFVTSILGFSNKASALGGSKTEAWGASLYLGVGLYFLAKVNKGFSAGGSISYSESKTDGMSSLIDINGDGLPDKVFRGIYPPYATEGLYFRPNISASANNESDYKFGDAIRIEGVSAFSATKSKSFSYGAKGYLGVGNFGANAGVDKSTTTTKTPIYFADVNNDGLIDVVDNERVFFNHITYNAAGIAVPSFSLSSSDTPSPIMGGGTIVKNTTTETLTEEQEDQDELVKASPMQDVVRVWQAPYAGIINIEGDVKYVIPTGDYDKDAYARADGVRVAIQVGGTEMWTQSIAKGDVNSYSANVSSVSIAKGQRVYFRVQSGNQKLSNGSFDRVTWSPVITYIDKGANVIDVNGYGSNVYKASEGDLKSSDAINAILGPVSVNVSGKFVKPVTTAAVTLTIVLSNDSCLEDGTINTNYKEQTVYTRTFGTEAFDGTLDIPIANSFGGQNLFFQVSAATDVAWEKVKWTPILNYTTDGQTYATVASVKYAVSSITSDPEEIIHGNSIDVAEYLNKYWNYGDYYDNPGNNIPVVYYVKIKPTNVSRELKGAKSFIMTVDFDGDRIHVEQEVNLIDGQIQGDPFITIPFEKGYTFNIGYYFKDADVSKLELFRGTATISYLTSGFRNYYGPNLTNYDFPFIDIGSTEETRPFPATVGVFNTSFDKPFGPMWRGWGQYVYNAMGTRYANPIDESLLHSPKDSTEADPLTMGLSPLVLDDATKSYWVGSNENVYIKGDTLSAARLTIQDVAPADPIPPLVIQTSTTACNVTGSNADAPTLCSKNTSTDKTGGVDAAGLSFTRNRATGASKTQMAFMDMNGDGYPDYVEDNQIQYTNTRGGRDGELLRGIAAQQSKSSSNSYGGGGDPIHAATLVSGVLSGQNASARAKAASDYAKEPAHINVSASQQYNNDEAVEGFVDVNGDGLPDKILSDKRVRLNLGYSFAAPVEWALTDIEKGESTSTNAGAGLGLQKWQGSFNAGLGIATCTSNTDYSWIDINGDGLPDKVRKDANNNIYVQFNLGNHFADEMLLDDYSALKDINQSSSTSESGNAAVTVNIPIWWVAKITINGGGYKSRTVNRPVDDIRDVDGDGYPDLVSSNSDGTMSVRRSNIGARNKLWRVTNSLGGNFALYYGRSKATSEHPGGKWVMDSVIVSDNAVPDDKPLMQTKYEYSNGKHDRYEREFLGFGKVVTKNINTQYGTSVYRTTTQEYDVRGSYYKGNLLRTTVADGAGNTYNQSENSYYSYVVNATANNYSFTPFDYICSDHDMGYTPLKYTKTTVYEGQTTGLTVNEIRYEYHLNGHFGELKNYTYSDKGNLTADGTGAYNYQTAVDYKSAITPLQYIFGLPISVKVTGSDPTKPYRQVAALYDDPINPNHITKVTQTIADGKTAETDLEYDAFGNISKKTLPLNYKNERMWYSYTYDNTYNMYPTLITDVFGYTTKLENYDYRFGVPCSTTDENGSVMTTTLDNVGRVIQIKGPNENDYTLKFEYHPQAVINYFGNSTLAYAVTKHYDPANTGNNIETVTFVDGFGRAVQVKKDGVIGPDKVMIVSGRAKYDALGRVKEAYYPTTETDNTLRYKFNAAFDGVTPTKTQYDILDRALTTTLPDGTSSSMSYTIEDNLLKTSVTDALNHSQWSYTNGSGQTVKTVQRPDNDPIITSFYYDDINQLDSVVDAMKKKTVSVYDMAGRRTQVTHPASGVTKFEYDAAGNLLSKQTANLLKGGANKKIQYYYTYHRLDSICYPDHKENNVKYVYGVVSDDNKKNNRIGRLVYQEDGSGGQEFWYGKQGELTQVRRTLVIPNQAVATYNTKWTYDSWNRLQTMTYPDGELLNYKYNTGGLLWQVQGTKSGATYNYVDSIKYDKFEQRTRLRYGNGAVTTYAYNDSTRHLQNLGVLSTKINKQIMNNAYKFDRVENILSVTNNAVTANNMGGVMVHTYEYDSLYRLKSANGTFTGANGKTAKYTLAMGYDALYNVVSKKQDIEQFGVQFKGTLKAGYDLNYKIADNGQQIANIAEECYRTDSTFAKVPEKKVSQFSYDPNGNLLCINTGTKKGDKLLATNSRKLLWDEENRLLASSDNGFVTSYYYDLSGERTVKMSGDNEGVNINGQTSGLRAGITNFTAYINPYLNVRKGGEYTKHIYIGGQRITSKVGNSGLFNAETNPLTLEKANKVNFTDKQNALTATIKDRYDSLGVAYKGTLQSGGLTSKLPSDSTSSYFYHSDHLGSSSLITDANGEIVQHIEYVPYGDTFIDERRSQSSWHTPFLFSGKERDEETGLLYVSQR